MAIFEFSQKSENFNFFRLQRLGLVHKNSNEGIAKKNAKNLHFWAFWAKMANFGQFLAKMGKTGIFSRKRLEHFSRAYKP